MIAADNVLTENYVKGLFPDCDEAFIRENIKLQVQIQIIKLQDGLIDLLVADRYPKKQAGRSRKAVESVDLEDKNLDKNRPERDYSIALNKRSILYY
jgi:hypothetical protein